MRGAVFFYVVFNASMKGILGKGRKIEGIEDKNMV